MKVQTFRGGIFRGSLPNENLGPHKGSEDRFGVYLAIGINLTYIFLGIVGVLAIIGWL